MRETALLARRALLQVLRQPEAFIPMIFIPIFFMLVNAGQVSKTFPSDTPFLHGQPYLAFQIPVSLLFAVSTAQSGLAMVTDIDIGYLDKLRTAPIRRTALLFGRLAADAALGATVSALILIVGYSFGAHVTTGVVGIVLLIALSAAWGVAFGGLSLAIALFTRSVAATNASFVAFFPLLFLTPNFVPSALLAEPIRTIAKFNPVSYMLEGMRDLVLLDHIRWSSLLSAVLVIAVTFVVLTGASLAALRRYGD
jgi:ABC-2 type transport system permease protein